jgi:hypothetical protein
VTDIPSLQRPSFFDGQRLLAADLNRTQSFHRELRWLHNRSLHNWGIAFGYEVTGKRKQRTVTIQPGYALDCQGRELILAERQEMAIPAVAGDADGNAVTYYLTASYTEDADLTPEMRAGICDTAGAVRRPERPIIRWQDPNEGYRFGLDVVLASIEVKQCQLASDASGAVRRDAIPEQQPYIFAGQTAQGETKWRLWPNASKPIGVASTVSTTIAGFRSTPQYQAHVIGERLVPDSEIVFDGYAQVVAAGPHSFDLVVFLPQGQFAGAVLNPAGFINAELPPRLESNDPDKDGLGWYVIWMGVEGS